MGSMSKDAKLVQAYVNDTKAIHGNNPDVDLVDQAFNAITKYLTQELVLETAVSEIAHWTINQPRLNEAYSILWSMILSAAINIPSRSIAQRLADLVAALASLPDAQNAGKQDGGGDDTTATKNMHAQPAESTITVDGQVLWRGLPNFGMEMRESWNGPSDHVYPQTSDPYIRYKRWTNINVFAACLVKSHASLPIIGAYRGYGLWTILSALEEDFHPKEYSMTHPDSGPAQVPAALAWLEIAGDEVASLVGSEEVGAEGRLYPEQSGDDGRLTVRRWEFWMQRLEGLSTDERMTEEERLAAIECLRIMKTLRVPG